MTEFISAVALIVSCFTWWTQKKHNKLSVLPLPEVVLGDYENRISVTLRNNGAGPLIIKKLTVSDANSESQSFISHLTDFNIVWSNFVDLVDGRAILPGKDIELIETNGNETNIGFVTTRDKLRRKLKDLEVKIVYTNVYGDCFPEYSKKLTWFGRHN